MTSSASLRYDLDLMIKDIDMLCSRGGAINNHNPMTVRQSTSRTGGLDIGRGPGEGTFHRDREESVGDGQAGVMMRVEERVERFIAESILSLALAQRCLGNR